MRIVHLHNALSTDPWHGLTELVANPVRLVMLHMLFRPVN